VIDRQDEDCYKHTVNRAREGDNGVFDPGLSVKDNDVLLVHEGSEGRFFLPEGPPVMHCTDGKGTEETER
jgi:hypothetical protein